jgi:ubiquitin carboxyl-terminal hydrolase 48
MPCDIDSIAPQNNKTLEELLDKSLDSEYLDGDNQYRCDVCAGLRDAKRMTEILTLPPVLHFSLLRFVFDPETLDRRKSSIAINFPKSIDMAKYLPNSHTDNGEVWYDLKGVLLHRGNSAHSGHYTAHIYDAK